MNLEYEYQVLSGERCEAIKIVYNGVNYRSKLEGKWAVYFDYLGVEYGYEVEDGFKTPVGVYCPDFFIYKTGWFIEVKAHPDLLTQTERDKIGYFETHLPEWANGIITVFGNPENTYDDWFLHDVLGIERTELDVKQAEYTAINKTFYCGYHDSVEPVYIINESCDLNREKLATIVYNRENIRKIAKFVLFGDIKTVKRIPVIESKEYDLMFSEAYRNIEKELSEYYIKPYYVDRCVQVYNYETLTNKSFDILAHVNLNGTINPKIKTNHNLIRKRISPSLPDGTVPSSPIKLYIKIISEINNFEQFFRLIKHGVRRYTLKDITRYVIFTNDARYKEQFFDIGVSIVTPSDIGVLHATN